MCKTAASTLKSYGRSKYERKDGIEVEDANMIRQRDKRAMRAFLLVRDNLIAIEARRCSNLFCFLLTSS